jgi:hypothetical protein
MLPCTHVCACQQTNYLLYKAYTIAHLTHHTTSMTGVAERTESSMKLFWALQVLAQIECVSGREVAIDELLDRRILLARLALHAIRPRMAAHDQG